MYARLLLEAMQRDQSPGAAVFNAERIVLCLRYERLLRTLLRYELRGWNGVGQPTFQALPDYLELLTSPPPVEIPRRPLSPQEAVEAQRRRALAEIVSGKAYRRRMLAKAAGDWAGVTRFMRADRAAWNWALTVERAVNPNRRMRTSGRLAVKRYLRDVAAFCERWRLYADWAVYAFIDHDFHHLTLGEDRFLIAVPVFWCGTRYRIVVQIPGTTTNAYERDRERFGGATLERMVEDSVGGMTNVTWTPSQAEQATIEREHDAACITVNWDGLVPLPSNTKIDGHYRALDYVVEECEARLRRQLTKRENRTLSRDIDCQLGEVNQGLVGSGWTVNSDAELKLHASWLARKLLNPKLSWLDLARTEVIRRYPRAIQRACKTFAERAGLRTRRQ